MFLWQFANQEAENSPLNVNQNILNIKNIMNENLNKVIDIAQAFIMIKIFYKSFDI